MLVKTGVKYRGSEVYLDLSNVGSVEEARVRVMDFQAEMESRVSSRPDEQGEPAEPQEDPYVFDPKSIHRNKD